MNFIMTLIGLERFVRGDITVRLTNTLTGFDFDLVSTKSFGILNVIRLLN